MCFESMITLIHVSVFKNTMFADFCNGVFQSLGFYYFFV